MKVQFLGGIAASLLLGMSFALPAFAQTTGQVNLSGEVESTLAIITTPTLAAGTLDLGGEGTAVTDAITKVADLAITTNNSAGYTLTVTSGNMVNPDNATPIAFKVTTVDDAAIAPASGGFTVNSGTDYTVGSTEAGQLDKDLYILYSSLALQDPGVYTATINLSIVDN